MIQYKFRIWDLSSRLLIYPLTIEFTQEGDVASYRYLDTHGKLKTDWTTAGGITQCTGIKDKNGKEIYEGDIIGISCGERATVKWSDFNYDEYGTYVECWMVNDSSLSDLDWNSTFTFAVIGNIYENQNLMENENEN